MTTLSSATRSRSDICDTWLCAAAARAAVAGLAARLDLVGLLALEMFLLPDGRLLANEMAPRPHNSGHWTMDACLCGQFAMHVRAVAGLPRARTMVARKDKTKHPFGAD